MISQFWFHGLRNCFIIVAECDLFLPLSLTKRLVNHTLSLLFITSALVTTAQFSRTDIKLV